MELFELMFGIGRAVVMWRLDSLERQLKEVLTVAKSITTTCSSADGRGS